MRSSLMRRTARLSTSLAPRSRMMSSKVRATPAEAVEDVVDGSSLLVGGFGLSGVPEALLRAVREKGSKNLTVVSSNVGTGERGLGLLFQTKQISKMIGSYVGENDIFEQQFLNGEIEVELVPMGTLAERMRAAGAGIPAFYTRTGSGTLVHHGGAPTRYAADGSRTQIGESEPRESRMFKVPRKPRCADSEYILEHALDGDFAFVKAWKADPEGNLVFRKTARNHNPAIATAGRITIAEVEEIVPMGEIPPDQVHIPGIYVNRVVQAERMGLIERLTLADAPSSFDPKNKPSDAMREKVTGCRCYHHPPQPPPPPPPPPSLTSSTIPSDHQARGARALRRRVRQPRDRDPDARLRLRPRRRQRHAAVRERHARRRAVPDEGERGARRAIRRNSCANLAQLSRNSD